MACCPEGVRFINLLLLAPSLVVAGRGKLKTPEDVIRTILEIIGESFKASCLAYLYGD